MNSLVLVLLIFYCSVCKGGVTEIPSKSEDDLTVEAVTDDTWMPSNVFDIKTDSKLLTKEKRKEIGNDLHDVEQVWDADSSPLFKVLRDFLFAGEDPLEAEELKDEDTTEEIVKILEKGLIEATTMFLNPSDDEQSTESSEDPHADPHTDSISITKIENENSDTLFDRIGLNLMSFGSSDKRQSLSIINITTSCSTCYESLETCVQQCFTRHNCHDVQRQVKVCPPPASRICNIFTQWGPVDECKEHGDCKSPLLCCSDGCVNKCSDGIWRD